MTFTKAWHGSVAVTRWTSGMRVRCDHRERRHLRCYASVRSMTSMDASDKSQSQHSSKIMTMWKPALENRLAQLARSASDGAMPLLPAKAQASITRHYEKVAKEHGRAREAAVLVLLLEVNEQPTLIFTERSADLSSHAAQISFPGGHVDNDTDANHVAAALRECEEELLPRQSHWMRKVHVLGRATPMPALNGTPVTPVIAVHEVAVDEAALVARADGTVARWEDALFAGNPAEVARVFGVNLPTLLSCETVEPLPDPNRIGLDKAPVYPVPIKLGNGPSTDGIDRVRVHKIWGLTAFLLRPLLHKLFKPALLTVK